MLYITCPTCGTFLGNKTFEYETKKEKICSDSKLNEEEQGIQIKKLIQSLKLRRYCCKMRLMTYKNQDQIIEGLPIKEE